jgi:hypothetical protein
MNCLPGMAAGVGTARILGKLRSVPVPCLHRGILLHFDYLDPSQLEMTHEKDEKGKASRQFA